MGYETLFVIPVIIFASLRTCHGIRGVDTDFYRGCFWDNANDRVLSDLIFCPKSEAVNQECVNDCSLGQPYCQSNSKMTLELCRSICEAQNFRFYSLQAGRQCFCGGDFSQYDVEGQALFCDYPCTGNSTQLCGGEYRMDVYEIPVPIIGSACFHPGYVDNAASVSPIDPVFSGGSILSYGDACPEGYLQEGSSALLCQLMGGWNVSLPTCTRRCSDPPVPMFGEIRIGGPKTVYLAGDSFLYICTIDSGKAFATYYNLKCSEEGEWTGNGLNVVCPDPTITLPPSTTTTTTTRRSTTTVPTTTVRTTIQPTTTPPTQTTILPTTKAATTSMTTTQKTTESQSTEKITTKYETSLPVISSTASAGSTIPLSTEATPTISVSTNGVKNTEAHTTQTTQTQNISTVSSNVTDEPPAVTSERVTDTPSTVTSSSLKVSSTNLASTRIPSTGTDTPSTVTNIPSTVTNTTPTVTNTPSSVTNIPPTVTNTPPTVTNIPPTVTNTPPTVTNTPPTVTNTPPTVTNTPSTVSETPLIRSSAVMQITTNKQTAAKATEEVTTAGPVSTAAPSSLPTTQTITGKEATNLLTTERMTQSTLPDTTRAPTRSFTGITNGGTQPTISASVADTTTTNNVTGSDGTASSVHIVAMTTASSSEEPERTRLQTMIPRLTKRPDVGGIDTVKTLLPYLLAAAGLFLFVIIMTFAAAVTCGRKMPQDKTRLTHGRSNGQVNGRINGQSNGGMNGHANGHVSSADNNNFANPSYKEGGAAFDNPAFSDDLSNFSGSPARTGFASFRESTTYDTVDEKGKLSASPGSPIAIGGAPPTPPPLPPPPLPSSGPPTLPRRQERPPPAVRRLPPLGDVPRGSYTLPKPSKTSPKWEETPSRGPSTPPATLPKPVRKSSSTRKEPLASTPKGAISHSELYAAINKKPKLKRTHAVALPIQAGDLNTIDSSYLSVSGYSTLDYDEKPTASKSDTLRSNASEQFFDEDAKQLATRL